MRATTSPLVLLLYLLFSQLTIPIVASEPQSNDASSPAPAAEREDRVELNTADKA